MHPDDTTPLSWADAESDPAWQTTDAGLGIPSEPRTFEPGWMNTRCGRAIACTCAAAGGASVAHAGCIITYAFAAASGGLPFLGTGLSVAVGSVGVAIHYAIRGKKARPLERVLVAGSVATGMIVTLGLHFSDASGHAHDSAATSRIDLTDPQSRLKAETDARALGLTLGEYLAAFCDDASRKKNDFRATQGTLDK